MILRLKTQGITEIVAIDKHPANTETLKRFHPDIRVLQADLADPTSGWKAELAGCGRIKFAVPGNGDAAGEGGQIHRGWQDIAAVELAADANEAQVGERVQRHISRG